jgi:hypothetical protein
VVRDVARPSSSATSAVEATPPPAAPAMPVVPGPAIAEPTPIRAATPANKSAEPAEGRGRPVRSRTTAKINKPREVGELSDKMKNSSEPRTGHGPRTGRW